MNKIMLGIVQQSLSFETLIRKVIIRDFPTRDEICIDPCGAFGAVLSRIENNHYNKLGIISDFRHDFLEGNDGRRLEDLLEKEWDFQTVYSKLNSIIDDYLQLSF